MKLRLAIKIVTCKTSLSKYWFHVNRARIKLNGVNRRGSSWIMLPMVKLDFEKIKYDRKIKSNDKPKV